MTGTIVQRQNGPRVLDLLAAQRALYNEIRLLRRLRSVLLAAGVASSMVLAFALTAAHAPVGLITGLCQLVLAWVVGGREWRRRPNAAAVAHEGFDTSV
jgi:hypothetical protein